MKLTRTHEGYVMAFGKYERDALIAGLDLDRNHPARKFIYESLRLMRDIPSVTMLEASATQMESDFHGGAS